ncbi:heparinase II/III domain-containing protein [Parafrankia discariae]|uniref:heparinase II/III domain-containing protein n=1 Tax=Parafrankia discariae TaxID=365528 RepID=UPI0005575E51|nr:heparinase II/III family protein [Parafrankia discariae]
MTVPVGSGRGGTAGRPTDRRRAGGRNSAGRMLNTAVADAAALGRGAVPRAAYEAAKRMGGHALVFGAIELLPHRTGGLRTLGLPRPAPTPSVEYAADATKGLVRLFGRRVDLGPRTDWHAVLDGPHRWPAGHWWRVDIRGDARPGDVKWAWELGRMRHLVLLARAVRQSGDQAALERLRSELESWFDQNPPERGIHWYSNLEIALRAFAFAQVHELAGEALGHRLRSRTERELRHSRRHLLADLPYTASSMRNNHWLGDSLGLLVLDRVLPEDRLSAPCRRLARALFDAQLRRQLRPDGSMIEDSLSYHRFVLEMLAVRMLADPTEPVREALVRAAQFLSRLGALEGPVPQLGDWDEGRLLCTAGDPGEIGGSVAVALALAGTGAPVDWRAGHDECAWYAGPGIPVPPERAEPDGHEVGGGIARAARGLWTSWLKVGSGPSHGHADLGSTCVLHDGHWVVGDPGTGTYNGALEQRNGLRSSAAHSVLRLAGQDQLVPHRVFRWAHTAHGHVGPPLRIGDAVVSWGFHDAYTRLRPARRVARVVVTGPDGVACADFVEGPPGVDWRLTLPLAPTAEVDLTAATLRTGGGAVLRLILPEGARAAAVRGEREPWAGWWSRTYGTVRPATWVCLAGRVPGPVPGPVLWAAHTGPRPPAACVDGELTLGSTVLRVEWGVDRVRLVARGEHEQAVSARPAPSSIPRPRPRPGAGEWPGPRLPARRRRPARVRVRVEEGA